MTNMLNLDAGPLRLVLDRDTSALTLWDTATDERLLVPPSPALFAPALNGTPVQATLSDVSEADGQVTLTLQAPRLRQFQVFIKANSGGGHFEVWSEFTPDADCELNALALFPPGTGLNVYDLVNFRNRHHTPHTWPELNVGGDGFETTTYSTDWQFAPHPTQFILRKGARSLFFGTLDLTQSFGMQIKAREYRAEHWALDYGPVGFGQKLTAGERFVAPRFALFLDTGKTVYETLDRWTGLLISQGRIPDPARKTRHGWHTAPLYCTWMDQGFKADVKIAAALQDQVGDEAGRDASQRIDEGLVREALGVIEREQMPFATILLDGGWNAENGEWEPHPTRLPNLRGLVDDIHARGMKVIVWWNWAEITPGAKMNPAYLIGGGTLNKHGARIVDYSLPATQAEYLEPLFYKMFSSDPGCYDLDGVKTDFLADKVHAEMPIHDPAWRGEESYFYRVTRLFYGLMRRFKPDACHIGCAGHPYLAEFIDINRTYDVASSDVREQRNRGLMLRATSVGVPVALDFHNLVEQFREYFDVAREHGFSVQVGNILGMKQDTLSDWEPADAPFLQIIKDGIAPEGTR